MMKFRFCPSCGAPTTTRVLGGRDREACAACSRTYFHNPIAAAAAVILESDRILLCHRDSSVFRGRWSIPAGFCEEDETVEQGAVREAKEEVGLDVEIVDLVDANSGFEVEGRPVVGVYFRARPIAGAIVPGDDVDDARFFPLDDVPDLPFAGDRRVIQILRTGRYPFQAFAAAGDKG
jgi:ADP-ribose pyrophosphatase YjhB (NUDIX family)